MHRQENSVHVSIFVKLAKKNTLKKYEGDFKKPSVQVLHLELDQNDLLFAVGSMDGMVGDRRNAHKELKIC